MATQRKPRYYARSTVAARMVKLLGMKLLQGAWKLQRLVSVPVQHDKFIPSPCHVPEAQEPRAAQKNDSSVSSRA